MEPQLTPSIYVEVIGLDGVRSGADNKTCICLWKGEIENQINLGDWNKSISKSLMLCINSLGTFGLSLNNSSQVESKAENETRQAFEFWEVLNWNSFSQFKMRKGTMQ